MSGVSGVLGLSGRWPHQITKRPILIFLLSRRNWGLGAVRRIKTGSAAEFLNYKPYHARKGIAVGGSAQSEA